MQSLDWNSCQERYVKDPIFHNLVDSLEAALFNLILTPSEIRQAAIFAAIRFEQHKIIQECER